MTRDMQWTDTHIVSLLTPNGVPAVSETQVTWSELSVGEGVGFALAKRCRYQPCRCGFPTLPVEKGINWNLPPLLRSLKTTGGRHVELFMASWHKTRPVLRLRLIEGERVYKRLLRTRPLKCPDEVKASADEPLNALRNDDQTMVGQSGATCRRTAFE